MNIQWEYIYIYIYIYIYYCEFLYSFQLFLFSYKHIKSFYFIFIETCFSNHDKFLLKKHSYNKNDIFIKEMNKEKEIFTK
jgi:hypothetical protein